MNDNFERKIEYLRLSVTDKCNLRCRYCMPPEGIDKLSHSDVLSIEEITRICSVLCDMGIRRIRLTGGEPLVRRGITDLVRNLSAFKAPPAILMTTNGVLLKDNLRALERAGLGGINISIDTTDREMYRRLTGKDCLADVMDSVDAAYDSGINVRINCVPIKDINDSNLADVAQLAFDRNIDVRFIELMPIGRAGSYMGMASQEVMDMLIRRFGQATEDDHEAPQGAVIASDGPAKYYRFPGFIGRIGFISPLSHPFCATCNRIRLTSTGMLRTCLYYPESADLKSLLRCGCSDDELKERIENAVSAKPKEHRFISTGGKNDQQMFQIGG